MVEVKFAQLEHEQIQEINQLEERLGVTLIAYDSSAVNGRGKQNSVENSNDLTTN